MIINRVSSEVFYFLKMCEDKNCEQKMLRAFDLLKLAVRPKQFMSFKNLPLGAYQVLHFSTEHTKNYGLRVKADMGERYVYLPERTLKDLKPEEYDAFITALNDSPKMMIYKGKNPNQKDR